MNMIEVMARAILNCNNSGKFQRLTRAVEFDTSSYEAVQLRAARNEAQAAYNAIIASGHSVVPIEPNVQHIHQAIGPVRVAISLENPDYVMSYASFKTVYRAIVRTAQEMK